MIMDDLNSTLIIGFCFLAFIAGWLLGLDNY